MSLSLVEDLVEDSPNIWVHRHLLTPQILGFRCACFLPPSEVSWVILWRQSCFLSVKACEGPPTAQASGSGKVTKQSLLSTHLPTHPGPTGELECVCHVVQRDTAVAFPLAQLCLCTGLPVQHSQAPDQKQALAGNSTSTLNLWGILLGPLPDPEAASSQNRQKDWELWVKTCDLCLL